MLAFFAGWGSLQGHVAEAAARSDRIEYLGVRTRDEVQHELTHARASLLPSLREDNSPYTLLEAQARPTPVIASNRGGPPEFVHEGEHGFLVDPKDVDGLAARIQALADGRELAEAMGRSGRERLLHEHRADVHYELLTNVYDEAMRQTVAATGAGLP